ncbi:hypothetical protein QR680_014604 [Steinernema hermaphroditum]|uniref:PCI domain-containing protein n=1 Tax=Steinernema hermaphroditum TaxID=289476 RepID=A0AA39IB45_9BILA|nr:hypothetical protein QR680_014604 [Steinernema hermaphroditum]
MTDDSNIWRGIVVVDVDLVWGALDRRKSFEQTSGLAAPRLSKNLNRRRHRGANVREIAAMDMEVDCQTESLRDMFEKNLLDFSMGKAKAAKLVRDLVNSSLAEEGRDGDAKVSLVMEAIQWAEQQNLAFLRQSLQARLIRLYNDLQRFTSALELSTSLVKELKKVDDKDLLVEVQLEESKSYYSLTNVAKAHSSLTSARTVANGIYMPPRMQAALDMQSGVLHAAGERDFKTAFSYFFEAFEGYDSVEEKPDALRALKYMLLCKVMLDIPEEVQSLLSQKLALKYNGPELEAMTAIASAAKKRSLAEFNEAFEKYETELKGDLVVKKHFSSLSETMVEKELTRLIEPYSIVDIDHVTSLIELPRDRVEKKLAQMILDQKICGTLHQDEGALIVYDVAPADATYETAVKTIHAMGQVVDGLYDYAKKLR